MTWNTMTSRRKGMIQHRWPLLHTGRSEKNDRRAANGHWNLQAPYIPRGVGVGGVINPIAENVHLARSDKTVLSRGSRTQRLSSSHRK
jgi:hypothetical protein